VGQLASRTQRSSIRPVKLAAVVAVAGASVLLALPAAAAKSRSPWKRLQGPLHLPQIAPGATCPVTSASGELPLPFVGMKFGRGPVYPNLGIRPEASLEFSYPPPPTSRWPDSEWGGQKVMWVRAPRYHGPALIRGRQIDGPDRLRFGGGLVPSTEIRIGRWGKSAGSRWGSKASTTRLRAAGCYAYQVDGLSFSSVVIFEARVWNSA
jgi:hypothetical protein